ncbi:MAG: hypothetical protein H9W82_16345 [Lactobacillus sp.]|nr:hypothetical protein [Lactobacillus sp.]
MRKILENFVPNRYKNSSKKFFSLKSFETGISGYILLLCIILASVWAGGAGKLSNDFLNLLRYPVIVMIAINVIGLLLFRTIKFKKYSVVISYFSGVLSTFFLVTLIAGITNNPKKNCFYGISVILIVWIIGMAVHYILVNMSLREGSMKLRDKYGDYFGTFVSLVAFGFFAYGFEVDNNFAIMTGIGLLLGALLISLTFSFPRILPYWRKEGPKKDVSVYGNATKLMKRGKSK